MADAQLQITIKARNQAKAEFDKLDKQVKNLQGQTGVKGLNKTLGDLDSKFKSVTGVSLGFATAAGAAGAAVSGLIKFMTDAVNETVAYATEIDNMSRLLGLSTEETSRLVQASDDLFISQQTLTSGLQAATRKGIDVSIEGLKKLADQYNSLPEGVTRSKFVLDTFGRSGAEMGKLMEQGAAGIDAATAAIADNMIITQKSMADIMNYKRSVDNLSDAWTGFKYTIGTGVIPKLDELIRTLTPGTDAVEEHYKKVRALNEQLMNLKKWGGVAGLSQEELAAQIASVTAQIDSENNSFYENQDAAEAARIEIEKLATEQETLATSMLSLTGSLQSSEESYQSKYRELMGERVKLLEAQKTATGSALTEINGDLLNNRIALEENVAAHELATNRIMLGYLQQLLAADGLTTAEAEALLTQGVNWGIYSESAVEEMRKVMVEMELLKNYIDSLPEGKTFTYTLEGEIGPSFRSTLAAIGGIGPLTAGRNNAKPKASGGPVTGGSPYIVGEVGPELFVPNTSGSIVPHNQLAGSTVVNFYYSPAISLTDRTEAETRLVPIIRKALARA